MIRFDPRYLVAIAAVAACIAGIGNDFVYDDLALIVGDDRLHDLARWREIVGGTYWPAPFPEDLYRPVASALLALQWVISGGDALLFRVVSVALYVGSSLAFFGLLRRLFAPGIALAAGVIFAVHPIHVEAVAQAVNQGELIVGILTCVSVGRYIDRRRLGHVNAADWTFLGAGYAVGILTKESAFVMPALLLASELIGVDNESWRARGRSLLPGYTSLVALAILVLILRETVLPDGALAATPAETMVGLGFGQRMHVMSGIVPHWLRLFVWPLRLRVDYQPDDPLAFGALNVIGILAVIGAATSFIISRMRLPVFSFGIAWCMVTLLPVSNVFPSGVVLAERTLFVPSMGFLIAAGAVVEAVLRRWPQPRLRVGLVVACGALAILGVIRSTSRELVWNPEHIKVVPRAHRATGGH
jgi:protein O-mannosyl-transferase